MYVAVIAFLIGGIARRGRAAEANVVEDRAAPPVRPADAHRPDRLGARWSAIGLDRAGDRKLLHRPLDGRARRRSEKLSITVTGNQWWWDVQL